MKDRFQSQYHFEPHGHGQPGQAIEFLLVDLERRADANDMTIFSNKMAAQGQSFFQASGDSDAYTGSQTLDNSSQTTAPVDSTNSPASVERP